MSKIIIIKIINVYQRFFSPDTGLFSPRRNTCVFYPTCSEYTKDAVVKNGAIKGLLFGINRIFHCHPWQKKTNDTL